MALDDAPGDRPFPRVRVLAKVRDVLDLFSVERPVLSAREIRTGTGLPATTCNRLLQNMIAMGLLDLSGDQYRIGGSVLRWAAVAREGLELLDVAAPELRRLRDETGETVGLFVRDGHSRVCVGLAVSTHVVGRLLRLGDVAPLHANAAGKALLAFDPAAIGLIPAGGLARYTGSTLTDVADLEADVVRTRTRGWALSEGEWDVDVSGVAAPVLGADGVAVAVLGLSVPSSRFAQVGSTSLGQAVRAAADRVTRAFGGRVSVAS